MRYPAYDKCYTYSCKIIAFGMGAKLSIVLYCIGQVIVINNLHVIDYFKIFACQIYTADSTTGFSSAVFSPIAISCNSSVILLLLSVDIEIIHVLDCPWEESVTPTSQCHFLCFTAVVTVMIMSRSTCPLTPLPPNPPPSGQSCLTVHSLISTGGVMQSEQSTVPRQAVMQVHISNYPSMERLIMLIRPLCQHRPPTYMIAN